MIYRELNRVSIGTGDAVQSHFWDLMDAKKSLTSISHRYTVCQ
jgi:hypothetical protein